MNRSITVPRARRAGTASLQVEALTNWRLQVVALLSVVESSLASALCVEDTTASGSAATSLIEYADSLLDGADEDIHHMAPEDFYGEVVLRVQAQLLGVKHMIRRPLVMECLLQPAMQALEAAAGILDDASATSLSARATGVHRNTRSQALPRLALGRQERAQTATLEWA